MSKYHLLQNLLFESVAKVSNLNRPNFTEGGSLLGITSLHYSTSQRSSKQEAILIVVAPLTQRTTATTVPPLLSSDRGRKGGRGSMVAAMQSRTEMS